MRVTPVIRGVVIASPGGLRGGGGMGSVTRMMVDWLRIHHPGVQVAVIDPRGERHFFWSLLRLPAALAQLLWFRIVRRYDVLHLQVSERMSFARKAALLAAGRAFGMQVVLHHHGAELIPSYREGGSRGRALVNWCAEHADINVVLGEVWKQFLVREVGVRSNKVVVRPNAAKDMLGSAPQASPDPWHFLVVANLSPRKGIGELMSAIAALRAAGSPAKLTLAGGGDVQRYQDDAKRLGIADYCRFTGWVQSSEVARMLRAAGTLVLPSYNEGLPMTILEALSARLPVVATPVGSIPEHLSHQVDCLFVSPGDVDGLVAALWRAASDVELRKRLAENGRLLYDQRFAVDGYMARLLSLYVELTGRPTSTSTADPDTKAKSR